ncbi:hypothetical protein N9L20_01915 [Flavobacteriaceae bacterium]|nr:hypothetical protein [Flavobacteriaceae bacterium]
MKTKLLRGSLILGLLLSLQSCDLTYFDGEIESFSWDGALAAPIGYVEYTVSELLEDTSSEDLEITNNDEGVITFVYTQQIENQGFGDAIEIGDQSFLVDFELPEEPFPLPIAVTETQEFSKEIYLAQFSDYNEELTGAYFDDGTIEITVSTNMTSASNIGVEIPTFKNVLDDSAISFSASFDGTTNEDVVRVFQLEDYYGDFTVTNSGVPSFNTILLDISAELIRAVGDQFGPGTYFEFSILLSGVQTTLIYGDFKTQTISVEDTSLEFDAFDAFGDGELVFAEPIITLSFDNSFGIPMGIDLSGLVAENSSSSVRLSGPITEEAQMIDAPAIGAEGTSVNTVIEINNTNSNIADLMSSKPTAFTMDVQVYTNPVDQDPNMNFMDGSSSIGGSVEVEIPMAVTFDNIPIEQVVDFDLGADVDIIDEMKLNIQSVNTMPLSGSVEMVFLDENGNELFTTTQVEMFAAAPVGSDGRSSGSIENQAELNLDKVQINLMAFARSVRIIAYLNTTSADTGQVVRLLDTDSLRIDLSTLIKFGS